MGGGEAEDRGLRYLATEESDFLHERRLTSDRFMSLCMRVSKPVFACVYACMSERVCCVTCMRARAWCAVCMCVCKYADRVIVEALHFTNGVQELQRSVRMLQPPRCVA